MSGSDLLGDSNDVSCGVGGVLAGDYGGSTEVAVAGALHINQSDFKQLGSQSFVRDWLDSWSIAITASHQRS
jgi:hypothetical protein